MSIEKHSDRKRLQDKAGTIELEDPSVVGCLDSDADVVVLRNSDIFDEQYYRIAAGLSPSGEAARHYLANGWRAGLEPSAGFEGAFLWQYFCSAGFVGPPALTYSTFRAAGWMTYLSRAEAESVAEIVRASGLFDAQWYRARLDQKWQILDPALHYVLVGEGSGMAPSVRFDPIYYRERYPDLAGVGMCLLVHYIRHGEREGRRPLPVAMDFPMDMSKSAPGKETIILVSHEASRTGAPIVALNLGQRLCVKYNIITVLLRGGSLVENFKEISAHLICLEDTHRHQGEFKYIVDAISREYLIKYAIVNSIASWDFISSLAAGFVPTVTLIHEFASYMRPLGAMRETLGWVTEPVFSTEITARSFSHDHPALLQRRMHIVSQGHSQIPSVASTADLAVEHRRLRAAVRPFEAELDLVVLGAGLIHLRKGVDLFLATAASVQRYAGRLHVRFVWIGKGYDPDLDMSYSVYLAEQIARSHLSDRVVILDEIIDFQQVYDMVDVFCLASRLDPLPNVAIDAALHGIPVICFEGASGIAEFLNSEPTAGLTVMPHLDVDAAARMIVKLAEDKSFRKRVGNATRTLARARFDMERYVATIDDIGRQAIETMRKRRADFETLQYEPSFDAGISLPAEGQTVARGAAISRFLAYWSATRTAPCQVDHIDLRRPCAGFNPQIYAIHHPELIQEEINPLADYVRRGYPEGPWRHPVIQPNRSCSAPCAKTHRDFRTAIHAHFHYPELVGAFLDKLAVNKAACDLLLSTNSERKAESLRAATLRFDRGRVEVRVVPNRGRDIGPLLSTYGNEIVQKYDVVGHFHGKRSLGVHPTLGETWREFLWQHLLGDFYPMMDIILEHFAQDENLGLVFAEEPHLTDWGSNLELAQKLAARAGLDRPLPPFFEYPVGTMFWLRRDTLAPLLNLGLDYADYPEEPIANDGTILHALERLVPFSAEHAGFTWATVHISGVTW